MNIKNALALEHSKKQTMLVAEYAVQSVSNFKALLEFYFCMDTRLSQRAAWVVSTVVLMKPEIVKPFLKKIIFHLKKGGHHDAVYRNGLKVLIAVEIPKNLNGYTADLCFNFLSNSTNPVAIRCFAMTVLFHIAKAEPELKNEITMLIKNNLFFESPGFKSRAARTMRELEQLKGEPSF